jgi:hypothetical protein
MQRSWINRGNEFLHRFPLDCMLQNKGEKLVIQAYQTNINIKTSKNEKLFWIYPDRGKIIAHMVDFLLFIYCALCNIDLEDEKYSTWNKPLRNDIYFFISLNSYCLFYRILFDKIDD